MGSKLYKQRHKEQGLCTDCSEKTILGHTLCIKHLAAQKARNKARRKRHREQGLCEVCSEKALPGRVKCFKHLMSDRKKKKENPVTKKARNEKWRKYWKEHNLCLHCGRPRDNRESNYCMNCREKIARPHWAYWHELRVRGISINQ